MGRQKQRSQLEAIDEINMTPLIDLTFLLLIIFMITAPLLQYGIDVSPPEMNAEPLKDKECKVVELNNSGEIVYNRKVISLQELSSLLEPFVSANPKVPVMVRADGGRPYREVIEVMKAVKSAGVTNISLITQAEE